MTALQDVSAYNVSRLYFSVFLLPQLALFLLQLTAIGTRTKHVIAAISGAILNRFTQYYFVSLCQVNTAAAWT